MEKIMKHSITVKSAEFGEAIKTAYAYASKDNVLITAYAIS